MKILFIVTYLYRRGGDSNHAFAIAKELEARNHQVFLFGMQDSKNIPKLIGPFAPRVDYREILKSKNPIRLLKALGSIYSFPARKALCSFIEKHGPFDIAHIHSTHHQLTMSTINAIKKHHIPFLWTLHDYKLICPNTSLFDDRTSSKCLELGKRSPFCIIRHRCKKNSLPASFLTALESWFNYAGSFYNDPECYVSPSSFLKRLIVERQVTNRPISVIPNFSPILPEETIASIGEDFVFIGRILPGKGINILINAFSKVQEKTKGKLIIIGSGPDENDLKKLAEKLLPSDRYEFTGHIDSSNEITNYYHQARCMVLPAIWYENMPLSILEAFAHARPVIASDIGGIPEMVIDGETGLLFQPGSVSELVEKLLFYSSNADKASIAGLNGWEAVKSKFSREQYIEQILKVYNNVVSGDYRQ